MTGLILRYQAQQLRQIQVVYSQRLANVVGDSCHSLLTQHDQGAELTLWRMIQFSGIKLSHPS